MKPAACSTFVSKDAGVSAVQMAFAPKQKSPVKDRLIYLRRRIFRNPQVAMFCSAKRMKLAD